MEKTIEVIQLLADACKIMNALLSNKECTEGEMFLHKMAEEKIDEATKIIKTLNT